MSILSNVQTSAPEHDAVHGLSVALEMLQVLKNKPLRLARQVIDSMLSWPPSVSWPPCGGSTWPSSRARPALQGQGSARPGGGRPTTRYMSQKSANKIEAKRRRIRKLNENIRRWSVDPERWRASIDHSQDDICHLHGQTIQQRWSNLRNRRLSVEHNDVAIVSALCHQILMIIIRTVYPCQSPPENIYWFIACQTRAHCTSK